MFKFKSAKPYWAEFSSYQTFQTVDELDKAVKEFISVYDLTDAIKAVLNTIKLYSKRFFGVCWLRKEQIAKKAGVSPSTVDRAIKGLKETGFLKVIPFNHTKFGRRTHNVYILNPFCDISDDATQEVANEVAQEDQEEPSKPCAARDSDDHARSHKNPNTNSHKQTLKISIGKSDILKNVPNEFVDLMEPFYADSPDIIHARWKTLLSACKKSCIKVRSLNWNTVKEAWCDVIKVYKRGKIKNATDDGIGAYFYGVLCDYFVDDFLRLHA